MDLSNNVISESVRKRKEKMISKSEWFGGNLKSKTVNYLNNVKFFSQKFYSWTFVHQIDQKSRSEEENKLHTMIAFKDLALAKKNSYCRTKPLL